MGGLLLGASLAAIESLLGIENTALTVLAITYTVLIAGIALLGNRSYSLFRINNFDEEEYSFEYIVPHPADSPVLAAPLPPVQPDAVSSGASSMLDAIQEQCAYVGKKYGLSRREQEVLVELVRGKTIASIADELTVSENTIKAHTKGIYRKLEVHTREELLGRVGETAQKD